MHYFLLFSAFALSLICFVESTHDVPQDEDFRLQLKATPGMQDSKSLEDHQIELFDSYLPDIVHATTVAGDWNTLDKTKHLTVGLTHVMHMALHVNTSKVLRLGVLGTTPSTPQSSGKTDFKTFSKYTGENPNLSIVELAKNAAVKYLHDKFSQRTKSIQNGKVVVEKASFFYDESLWEDVSDAIAGPYIQFVLAFANKKIEKVPKLIPVPEKRPKLGLFTKLFQNSGSGGTKKDKGKNTGTQR